VAVEERIGPVAPDADRSVADRSVPARSVPARHREPFRRHAPVLGVIALGGGLGAVARYGASLALPTPAGGFPWGTFAVNVTGCLLIGVLVVLVTEVRTAHRLVRPFLGVGVLGGFTTFSTHVVEVLDLLRPGTVVTAYAYLVATLVAALLAVAAGTRVTRALAVRPADRGRRS
jgi:CrcB protein